jgi:hypothetical protein
MALLMASGSESFLRAVQEFCKSFLTVVRRHGDLARSRSPQRSGLRRSVFGGAWPTPGCHGLGPGGSWPFIQTALSGSKLTVA